MQEEFNVGDRIRKIGGDPLDYFRVEDINRNAMTGRVEFYELRKGLQLPGEMAKDWERMPSERRERYAEPLKFKVGDVITRAFKVEEYYPKALEDDDFGFRGYILDTGLKIGRHLEERWEKVTDAEGLDRCKGCKWFDRFNPDEIDAACEEHYQILTDIGLCRFKPPTADRKWPKVHERDWCGNHTAIM